MSWGTTTSLVLIIFSVILADILCEDVKNIRPRLRSPWQTQNNQNYAGNGTQVDLGFKTTTPWPLLGHDPSSNRPSNSHNQQPMWTLPNGSTNWVRNTASITNPNQNVQRNNQNTNKNIGNSGTNYNIDFINREKGGNTFSNSKMTIASPTQLPVVSVKPTNVMNQALMNTNRLTNNQGTSKRPPSPSYANVLGNSGNQGVQLSKPINNIGLPNSTSTGSTLTNRRESQNVPSFGSNSDNGGVEDYELREFSEELYNKDTNNLNRYVTLKLQGMTTSRSSKDEAPEPLLTVSSEAYNSPSVAKLMLLYNNYILESKENEIYTAQEKLEENDLLDTILATPVMQHTRNFLIKKGKLGKDPKEFKDLLKLIWFQMYSRGSGRIGSSGFEHVFLTELKNNKVSGLHNWLYFNEEEKKHNANYLGYMRKVDLGNKGAILKFHFTFHNVDKPVGSMFVGTSPEVEMALYSTCFILRADKICPLKINGNKFIIRTYTYRYRGKNMIGSAFPEI